MKNIISAIIAIALVILAAAPAVAQDIDLLGQPDMVNQKTSGQPADVEINNNDWREGGISNIILTAIVASMIEQSGDEIAANTARILREGFERDQLIGSKWVDTDSERFKEKTLKPAQVRYEVLAGGDSDSGSNRIGLGRDSIDIESGSATAFITLVVRDLTTGKARATITGRGSRGSTNLEGLNLSSRFSWRGRGFPGFDYTSRSNRGPEWRRGMVAVIRALDDLEFKLKEYQRTGQAPKEDWRGRLPK